MITSLVDGCQKVYPIPRTPSNSNFLLSEFLSSLWATPQLSLRLHHPTLSQLEHQPHQGSLFATYTPSGITFIASVTFRNKSKLICPAALRKCVKFSTFSLRLDLERSAQKMAALRCPKSRALPRRGESAAALTEGL